MFRILILLSLITFQGWAQSSTGKQILGKINDRKWEKAEQAIVKTLSKDSTNVEVNYLASLLFIESGYHGYNIDSANRHILSSLAHFPTLSIKDREKLKTLPMDSAILMRQKEKTDSLAFGQSKKANTEEAYIHFIHYYPTALQTTSAIKLRDEAAFTRARETNSLSAYKSFLKKYPNSVHINEAQYNYDHLLYNELIKKGQAKDFTDFIDRYPASSFRSLAEKQLFEIITANGSSESLVNFINQYPQSRWAKKANDILYYLQDNYTHTHKQFITDSLQHVIDLNKSYWVPFLKSNQYGFMNSAGEEKMSASFEDIHPDYLCGDIQSDYLITSKGIISRNEKLLFEGEVKEVKDLNDGFLKIITPSSTLILHKSGFAIQQEEITDAKVLSGRFLLVNKPSGWGIISFAGRELLPFSYEDISSFDDWIVLTKNGKKIVVTADQVGAVADQHSLPQSLVFDDVRRWTDGLCWVRNDALEGVIDESLEFVIPLDRQVLSKTPFGFLRKKGNEFFIEGIQELKGNPYDKITLQGQWMLTREAGNQLKLYEVSGKKITAKADSIWFEKNIALVKSNDSIHAWLKPNLHLDFNLAAKATLFGRDSSAWIVVDEKNKKAVYDALSGKRLFIGDFEKIESIATNIFLVTKGNKKGMMDEKGKIILAVEYDAIIQPEPGRFSLLKDRKFGLFDLATRKLIKPAYERNVVQYNKEWFTAFKGSGWGFIQTDTKSQVKFQYNEILYWNDSVAWVKENFQWKLLNFKTGHVVQDKIKDFSYVKKYPHEHIVIIHQDNYYGVISSRTGVIIPSTFTDIINLGDSDTPLYFTEKHVEEADISVVIYYDQHGKLLRKQALDGEEYERIFCEEN